MMRRSIGFGMVLASVLAADAVAAASREIRVPLDSGCVLSVDVVLDGDPACWRLACPGKAERELACDVTAMHQVSSVMLGEAGTTLAVVSVGEGHPILELVPLAPLVDAGVYSAACTINPFPGTFSDITYVRPGWQVEATVDLLKTMQEARANSIMAGPWTFQVNSARCTPKPIEPDETCP